MTIIVLSCELIQNLATIENYQINTILLFAEITFPLILGASVLAWALVRIRSQSKQIPNSKMNQKLVIIHLVFLTITVIGQALLMGFAVKLNKENASARTSFRYEVILYIVYLTQVAITGFIITMLAVFTER